MVRVGDHYTAINGSKCEVIYVDKPIYGMKRMFKVQSLNCNGQWQQLWYEMDGQCRGPDGKHEWGGDDIVHGLTDDEYFVWWR